MPCLVCGCEHCSSSQLCEQVVGAHCQACRRGRHQIEYEKGRRLDTKRSSGGRRHEVANFNEGSRPAHKRTAKKNARLDHVDQITRGESSNTLGTLASSNNNFRSRRPPIQHRTNRVSRCAVDDPAYSRVVPQENSAAGVGQLRAFDRAAVREDPRSRATAASLGISARVADIHWAHRFECEESICCSYAGGRVGVEHGQHQSTELARVAAMHRSVCDCPAWETRK